MQIMWSNFNQKNKTERETWIWVALCPSGGLEGPWGCSESLPTIPFQGTNSPHGVTFFHLPPFLPFAMEILEYFMVGRELMALVWYSSGGGKSFVREKFVNWLESQLWDQSFLCLWILFEEAEGLGLSLATKINTFWASFQQIDAKEGKKRWDQNIKRRFKLQNENEKL